MGAGNVPFSTEKLPGSLNWKQADRAKREAINRQQIPSNDFLLSAAI